MQIWNKPSFDLHCSRIVQDNLLTCRVLEQAIFWPTQLWYSPGASIDLCKSSHPLTCRPSVADQPYIWSNCTDRCIRMIFKEREKVKPRAFDRLNIQMSCTGIYFVLSHVGYQQEHCRNGMAPVSSLPLITYNYVIHVWIMKSLNVIHKVTIPIMRHRLKNHFHR